MYWNRWIVFVACALLQASAGLNYSFSIFAPALKELFHLDEVQLGAVATLGFNMGGYLALLSGSVYDGLGRKNHVGPRAVALTGAALLFTGYLGIYGMATGLLPYHYLALLTFALVAGNAGCWFDTCALATCIQNYPDDRGTVVGILKSFLGLTATIYTAVYLAVFQPNTVHFILFLAMCPSAVAVLLSVFINKVPLEFQEEDGAPGQRRAGSSAISKHARFAAVYCVVAVVALVGMAIAIWSSQHQLGGVTRRVIVCILVGLLALLVLVPVSTGPYTYPRRRHLRHHRPPADEAGMTTPLLQQQKQLDEPVTAQQQADTPGVDAAKSPGLPGGPGRTGLSGPREAADVSSGLSSDEEEEAELETLPRAELTAAQAAQTLAFWIIVFQALMGVGTGLAFLNNLSGIVVALGGNIGGQVVFVSLFSVANASGRLVFGYISEHFLHTRGTRRTLFLILLSALMTAFAACMAFATLPDLYPMALLGGFAFGGHWAVIPSILADLFGLAHFASTYTMFQFSPAIGAYLLGTVLVGYVYEAAKAAGNQAGDTYCIGRQCYETTWVVLTGLNLLSLVGTRVLWQVTASTYEDMRRRPRG